MILGNITDLEHELTQIYGHVELVNTGKGFEIFLEGEPVDFIERIDQGVYAWRAWKRPSPSGANPDNQSQGGYVVVNIMAAMEI